MHADHLWLKPPAYASLGEAFARTQDGAPAAAPRLLFWNARLASECDEAPQAPDPALLAGARAPAHGSGYATAYAGHQFGHFVPQLGDGRALLLGDLRLRGRLHELQLKGSGRTPFSRGGDGRAALGPVLREVIVAEAMHALGVPTTRALAAVATGEQVWREAGPQPGAVLARIASSHVRVGSFEYFAARRDIDGLKKLTEWTLARHAPECAVAERPALALLAFACARQAALVARWLSLGFVHGVMNTDNMTLSGETIDYGPCAFLDHYQANQVFSSIDRDGRYAFANQPAIAQWNLARLAECLLPLIDDDPKRALERALALIEAFPERFAEQWTQRFAAKLGLEQVEAGDFELARDFLALLEAGGHDFTLSFRHLGRRLAQHSTPEPEIEPAFEDWLQRWRRRLGDQPEPALSARLAAANPALIPRNHHVEAALQAAQDGDLQPFETLMQALAEPYREGPAQRAFMVPPQPAERVTATFCGT